MKNKMYKEKYDRRRFLRKTALEVMKLGGSMGLATLLMGCDNNTARGLATKLKNKLCIYEMYNRINLDNLSQDERDFINNYDKFIETEEGQELKQILDKTGIKIDFKNPKPKDQVFMYRFLETIAIGHALSR